MTNVLYGREVAKQIKNDLKTRAEALPSSSFLAIIQTGTHQSSAVYVNMKKKFGESIGLEVKIYGQQNDIKSPKELEKRISELNDDDNCLGIILQLPLDQKFTSDTQHYCSLVAPSKDVDGLGGVLSGLANTGLIDFLPATPAAVLRLMQAHNVDDYKGKNIAILGQSNLVGRPLANAFMLRGATVHSFNEYSDQKRMKELCRKSDIVVSCTGQIHLVNEEFIRDDQSQIVIDVGYGHKDGKAVGDVDFDAVVAKVKAITPVPGGVGPLTVAQLFENTLFLYENNKNIKHYLGI